MSHELQSYAPSKSLRAADEAAESFEHAINRDRHDALNEERHYRTAMMAASIAQAEAAERIVNELHMINVALRDISTDIAVAAGTHS
jgi:hypothetical protein